MRRPNGTGTIVKMSGGRRKPYAVRISYRDKRNRVQQKYLSFHESGKEAQTALDAYNANRDAAPPPDKLSVTVKDIYALWSSRKYAKSGPASVSSYKASWGRLSALSGLKMRDVTIDHLQSIIDDDERSGLSKSTLNNDKVLMKALFKFALERDIVVKDYSEFVQLPQVDAKYEKGSFTDTQLRQIKNMAAAGEPWADTVLILCYTGFRITEFLTLTRFSYHEKDNYLQGGIKTTAGKDRLVPVHPVIRPYLSKWLARDGDTIICSETGKLLSSQWYRSHAFRGIMEKLGVPEATPHWCRHTFSTRLHSAGVAELEQKRLMGHADKDVTEHYTHTDIAQLTAAIRKLA